MRKGGGGEEVLARLLIRSLAVGLAAGVISQPAGAWGPLGHHAIGAVADAMLSPAARAEVARLLADDRDRDGNPSHRTTLAEVSVWADEIRGGDADRPKWHYDNMPVCASTSGERAWCEREQCASGRIEPLLAQLADRSAPPAQRREALKWIAHLVGDMHQPLHAADYAQGGNQVHVRLAARPDSTPVTLHFVWDVRLVNSVLRAGGSDQPPPAALRSLIVRARALSPALAEARPAQWLVESNRLARRVALDYPGFSCNAVPTGTVELTRAYRQRAQRVVTAQLALAGARLAIVLNRALDSPVGH
jgi:S1/P1 Nuclease